MTCYCDGCGCSEWFANWVEARSYGWCCMTWFDGDIVYLCPECDDETDA